MSKIYRKESNIHFVAMDKTESIDAEDVEAYTNLGYEIIAMAGANGEYIYRKSIDPDGYIRDMKGIEWSEGITLYTLETDHSKWSFNVSLWFDGASNNEEYLEKIRALYPDVEDVLELLESAKKYMMSQRPKKANSHGKRRGNIHNWLLGDKIPFASKVAKRLLENTNG